MAAAATKRVHFSMEDEAKAERDEAAPSRATLEKNSSNNNNNNNSNNRRAARRREKEADTEDNENEIGGGATHAKRTLTIKETLAELRRLGMTVDVAELEKLLGPKELYDLVDTKMTPELVDYIYRLYGVSRMDQLDAIFLHTHMRTKRLARPPPPRNQSVRRPRIPQLAAPAQHEPKQTYAPLHTIVPFATSWDKACWNHHLGLSLEGMRIYEYEHARRTSFDPAIRDCTGPLKECLNNNVLGKGLKCHRLQFQGDICYVCWKTQNPQVYAEITRVRFENLAVALGRAKTEEDERLAAAAAAAAKAALPVVIEEQDDND